LGARTGSRRLTATIFAGSATVCEIACALKLMALAFHATLRIYVVMTPL
jgi:hypothetical protein